MSTITIEEAQARLPEVIARLQPGDDVIILVHDQPVARLVAASTPLRKPRRPGSAIGKLTIIAEDNEHLEDFREYMP